MVLLVVAHVTKISAKKNKNLPSHSSKGSEPTPARITGRITPMKHSLRLLRLWKEYQKRKSSSPKLATSYRRKKTEKKDLDLPDVNTELYQDSDTSDGMEATTPLYQDSGTSAGIEATTPPVLLVDGYNVCGYWPKLKKHVKSGRLDIARQKLIEELVTFGNIRDIKVVVVFDAMMSGLHTHEEEFFGVDVVYSAETCADAWIEKEVAALREDGCPRVWVATSDWCHQQAAHGAGAFIWSSKALVSEIDSSKKELDIMLEENKSTSMQGKLLRHNLDSQVVDALKDLRSKLSETESHIKKKGSTLQGKVLKHNRDPHVVDALKDLRSKLSETESHIKKKGSTSQGKGLKPNRDPELENAFNALRERLSETNSRL